MKINFLKRCAAVVMAISVLSMGLVANAAEGSAIVHGDSPNSASQKVYGDSEWISPDPTEGQVPYDQYLSALMDVYYRNDSQAFVALGLGTAEDAALIYNSAFDFEYFNQTLDSFFGMEFPETLENDLRLLMAQLLSGARYAVTGCELQEDGSYEITVIYEQMIIFEPFMELYMAVVMDMANTWAADYASFPGEEEMMIQLLAALCSSLRVSLENVTYADPAITTVSIRPQNGTYLPDLDDIDTLAALLFDTSTVLN